MEFLLLALLGLLAAYLFGLCLRLRALIRGLEAAIRERKHFLATEGTGQGAASGLIRAVNALVDESNERSRQKESFLQQVEATFGAVQDAVFVLDERRTIVFANEAAVRWFENGRILRGARLEGVLLSPVLLEFLEREQRKDAPGPERKEIAFSGGDEDRWYEASCARLEELPGAEGPATLLVLHDITRLKRLEMIRRDFVANVSHELRTPLTIIKGFAETLAEDNETLSKEDRARFLDKILKNAQRLHLLMEDLLTLSRLESKPEQFNPDRHSLKDLLKESCEIYRTRLNNPVSQRIELDFDERVGEFLFDRLRVNQVVDNLLENVFRYAPEFSRVTVRTRLLGDCDRVECSVSDDGPGIPEKDVPHIFKRFYRVDKGRSRIRGGTGLGLSIAKHIVQLHGGDVRAESREGEGTTIFFELPYRREGVTAAEPAATEPLNGAEEEEPLKNAEEEEPLKNAETR